ncbi:pseudouridine 5'-phosphatase [Alternaria panax]|uniref:Pseudouridine 5'-phosphatase n=1 Tax=Alternaria panax TaxID=48097 RepID=A0AAD4FAH9_9PLEO|nr:pseudouridine 5'-phosphatase [Alternaria panax]
MASLPPVRACIFDVDGTLINSEDIYTDIYNNILREYGRPDYPWNIKATQQSRGTRGTKRLLDWAQVPLTPAEWSAREKDYTHLFKNSKVLSGVSTLLATLKTQTKPPVLLSLASSAGHQKFALKTSHIPAIQAAFDTPAFHVFGDDPEMSDSRKKPEPDIFLLALKRLNDAEAARGETSLEPGECLVFEDSIAGVEAARRAGMRVVWVPHPGLAEVCKGREMDVLMGRTEEDGYVPKYGQPVEGDARSPVVVDDGRLMSDDGMAELRFSLEDFPYAAYGISVVK